MVCNWYSKCMPKIKEIDIKKISKCVNNINNINKTYIIGSYVNNFKKPEKRIKDLDIIIKSNICSEDLLAINNDIINNNYSDKKVIENGFNPIAVKFTKKITDIPCNFLDIWTISSDKKILHWGAILSTIKESKIIKKDAENFAYNKTGYSVKNINNKSIIKRNNWYSNFSNYIKNYLIDMPYGWYESKEKNIKKILKNSMKL